LVATDIIQAEQAAFTGVKPEPVTVTELKAEVTAKGKK
jgi:hypothetical protein